MSIANKSLKIWSANSFQEQPSKSHATQMYITLTHEIFLQPNFIEN